MNCKKVQFNDISTFEHYKLTWDKVIFEIIEKGETSVFDIQDYFDYYDYEWEKCLDALAYFKYVNFNYPNITTHNYGKYVLRKVIITKEEFEEIIKKRKESNVEIIPYSAVLQKLKSNLIAKLKQMLPLVNCDGRQLTKDQKNLVYKHISRDLVYATESETHLTLEHLESYCNEHSLKHDDLYCCKIYELDDVKDFDKQLSKSMLVFASCKTSELYDVLLDGIIDDDYPCIEVLSFNSNIDIKNNFEIIAIYPKIK